MLSLVKMVSEMIIDYVPILVSQISEGIFGPLARIGNVLGLDRLLG